MAVLPVNHVQNPVLAGIDLVTVSTIVSYWMGFIHNFVTPVVATLSLFLSAVWYGYCLYEALEKRINALRPKRRNRKTRN